MAVQQEPSNSLTETTKTTLQSAVTGMLTRIMSVYIGVPHVRLIIAAQAWHRAYAVANLTSLLQTLTAHQQAVASETESCTNGPAQQQDVTMTFAHRYCSLSK